MKKVRCAIYTRKSSEDGLEQSFNSLHAQREACAAYILSQASEGWTMLPDAYDDGGLSGGTLERPALQRLLGDIAAGKIDIVVVYKVDRLSRSLMDFAKIVEAFDTAGTSFVSVTQSFNTTTSMGRLTLNMLLSFAQFEREVTAERIRDKIAASKAKGMWMGGTPPVGYRPAGRTLEIVEEHAAIVRHIFQRYLEVDSVRQLSVRLEKDRIFSPVRHTADGRRFGGGSFSRGQLYVMLRNRIYIGEIAHRDQVHAGQHPPIIDRDIWEQVQDRLAGRVRGERQGKRIEHPSLLAGLMFDEAGQPLVAAHTCKGTRRYRYYVSRGLHHRHEELTGPGIRIPAREIETAVAKRIAEAFEEPLTLVAAASLPLEAVRLATVSEAAQRAAGCIRGGDADFIRQVLTRVQVESDCARLTLSARAVAACLDLPSPGEDRTFDLNLAARIKRSGKAVRLIQPDGRSAGAATPEQSLVQLVAKAHRWWSRLRMGDIHAAALAREEGVSRAYLCNAVRLAFLSPPLVETILTGRQPARLSARLLMTSPLPYSWTEQQAMFG